MAQVNQKEPRAIYVAQCMLSGTVLHLIVFFNLSAFIIDKAAVLSN